MTGKQELACRATLAPSIAQTLVLMAFATNIPEPSHVQSKDRQSARDLQIKVRYKIGDLIITSEGLFLSCNFMIVGTTTLTVLEIAVSHQ
jgi:hypothetical protein